MNTKKKIQYKVREGYAIFEGNKHIGDMVSPWRCVKIKIKNTRFIPSKKEVESL